MVFQACKALGNCKPQLLQGIELSFWKALINIATGGQSAFSALQHFLSGVPWDKLQHVPEEDCDFFHPGMLLRF